MFSRTQYSADQLRAVEGNETHKIIIAPAGSGKTFTLIGCIQRCRQLNPNYHIVAITFTRKAAAELSNRIGAMNNIEVSTIHSWAWRELHRLGTEYGFKVELLEDDTIREILKKLCYRRRQYYINQFQLFSYVMGNYNIDVDDNIKHLYEGIRNDYIKYKRDSGLYDFTDLPTYLYDKLQEHGEVIRSVDALFVDEFQDIDPVQYDVFNLVQSKQNCYIGDPNQAIYAFRGAIEDVFDQLTESGDYAYYQLDTNFRSYQEIMDYATTFLEHARGSNRSKRLATPLDIDELTPSPVTCMRGHGGEVYVLDNFSKGTNLINGETKDATLLVKTFLNDKNTQILCRANKQVKKLESLGMKQVSTVHQAKGLEYDNVIMVSFDCDCTEETNIAYVAATRAKNKLLIIDYEILVGLIAQHNIQQPISKKLF